MSKKNPSDLSLASTDQLLTELAKRCNSMAFIGFFPASGGSQKIRFRVAPNGGLVNAMGLCDILKSHLLHSTMTALGQANIEPVGDDDAAD